MRKEIPFQRYVLWGILAIGLVATASTILWTRQVGRARQGTSERSPLEGLKVLGTVPDFALIERGGRQVDLGDLKGKIWVANFIYTNCPDTCPVQSAQMKELQTEFHNDRDLRLVSITVDPKRDTRKVLSEYADRFGADPERWLFLTGEERVIHRFAEEGFRLGAAEIPIEKRAASGATHTHSARFVLIDRGAQIRGYYASTDAEAMVRLRRDLKTLLPSGE